MNLNWRFGHEWDWFMCIYSDTLSCLKVKCCAFSVEEYHTKVFKLLRLNDRKFVKNQPLTTIEIIKIWTLISQLTFSTILYMSEKQKSSLIKFYGELRYENWIEFVFWGEIGKAKHCKLFIKERFMNNNQEMSVGENGS